MLVENVCSWNSMLVNMYETVCWYFHQHTFHFFLHQHISPTSLQPFGGTIFNLMAHIIWVLTWMAEIKPIRYLTIRYNKNIANPRSIHFNWPQRVKHLIHICETAFSRIVWITLHSKVTFIIRSFKIGIRPIDPCINSINRFNNRFDWYGRTGKIVFFDTFGIIFSEYIWREI